MRRRWFGGFVPSEPSSSRPDPSRPLPDVVRIPTRVPFPVPPANVFLFLGEEPTIVDTGTGTDEAWQDLVEGLAAHDLQPGDVRRVLVSHYHMDHAGNAKRLRDLGAEVCVHKRDAEPVRTWSEVTPQRNKDYAAGLQRAGMPQELIEKLDRRSHEVDVFMQSCMVDRQLEEGDTVKAGDRSLRVLHTPGHTSGSAVYVDRDEPLAATGDTLLERITPNALTVRKEEAGALSTYLQTLRRLEQEKLGMILPGHGVPFYGAQAVIERAFTHYEARREKILGHLQDSPEGLSVWDLVVRLWPDPTRGSAFLMVSEVLGHLELLVESDETVVTEGEIAIYQAA